MAATIPPINLSAHTLQPSLRAGQSISNCMIKLIALAQRRVSLLRPVHALSLSHQLRTTSRLDSRTASSRSTHKKMSSRKPSASEIGNDAISASIPSGFASGLASVPLIPQESFRGSPKQGSSTRSSTRNEEELGLDGIPGGALLPASGATTPAARRPEADDEKHHHSHVSPPAHSSHSSHGGPAASADFHSRLPAMLSFNESFVAAKSYEGFRPATKQSDRRIVVITCMDSRLIELLPKAINVKSGEAKIIKTAGAILTHPFGGIMRSVLIAIYELRANEVFVIGHHDCGMSNINPQATVDKMMTEGGISAQTISTLQYAGINIHRWLHGFDSVYDSVRNSVAVIRNHPLVPHFVPIHGLIIDPVTGKLSLVHDGTFETQTGDNDDTTGGGDGDGNSGHGGGGGGGVNSGGSHYGHGHHAGGSGDPSQHSNGSAARDDDGSSALPDSSVQSGGSIAAPAQSTTAAAAAPAPTDLATGPTFGEGSLGGSSKRNDSVDGPAGCHHCAAAHLAGHARHGSFAAAQQHSWPLTGGRDSAVQHSHGALSSFNRNSQLSQGNRGGGADGGHSTLSVSTFVPPGSAAPAAGASAALQFGIPRPNSWGTIASSASSVLASLTFGDGKGSNGATTTAAAVATPSTRSSSYDRAIPLVTGMAANDGDGDGGVYAMFSTS